jgi:hypothetical protein
VTRLLGVLAPLALMVAACGGGSTLSLEIRPEVGEETLDDLSRLDYRVYTVDEVDEVLAEATNPDGTPVTGISCDAISIAAPSAENCFEAERTVLRDGELLAEGDVPASGRIDIDDRSGDVRVYVELPGDQLEIDEHGHLCRWNAAQVVPADDTDVIVTVLPRC